jgi:AcrR family transcriptional regulator
MARTNGDLVSPPSISCISAQWRLTAVGVRMSPDPRVEPSVRTTEREVYGAAVRLISKHGYSGMSLRQVAAEVGIRMSSVYYYFPSKQDLLVAIMTRTMAELLAAARKAVARASDPVSALTYVAEAHVAVHADSTKAAFVTDSELRSLEPENLRAIIALRDEYQQIFADVLAAGARESLFEIDDLRPTVLAVLSMLNGVATWYRPDGDLTVEQIVQHHMALVLRGIGSPATRREWESQ